MVRQQVHDADTLGQDSQHGNVCSDGCVHKRLKSGLAGFVQMCGVAIIIDG